jgi:Transglycosylase SLT domain
VTAGSALAPTGAQGLGARVLVTGSCGLLVLAFVFIAALAAVGGSSLQALGGASAVGQPNSGSALARREIPPLYLQLYAQAAQRYGLDWAILAGIGKVECDHGRDPAPSCTHEGAVNSAGAGGPMQFIASTWARYGLDADGDGKADRWDPADAIYAAADYLHASGAPGHYKEAIYAYNHASWYVTEVEAWAARYRASLSESGAMAASSGGEMSEDEEGLQGADTALQERSPTPVRFIAGDRAQLMAGDGHLALVPTGAPETVQAMVVAGNELQGLAYGPAGHPDPLGVREEDCSSTVNYVLYRSAVRPLAEILKDNPLAQDYVHWGLPGPGHWVTIYATDSPIPHVFIVIAGLRLDTSHDGTDVGPNRDEDGPRWRILEQTPTWARWSVRHPPGL